MTDLENIDWNELFDQASSVDEEVEDEIDENLDPITEEDLLSLLELCTPVNEVD